MFSVGLQDWQAPRGRERWENWLCSQSGPKQGETEELTKPGQPLYPEQLSCKLSLPFHAAPHTSIAAAACTPCPASWDSQGADKQNSRERLREQDQGWVPGGVKAQQPLTPWSQPSGEVPCSCLSCVGQSRLAHTSTMVQRLWHGLRAGE